MENPKTTRTRKLNRLAWSFAANPIFVVALAGYAVVGLFALVYGIVGLYWPDLSQAALVTIAALAAAPLALALLWDRLGGVKAFGLELTLTPPSTPIETDVVVGQITEEASASDIDSLTALAEKIAQAIARPQQELLEINLRDGKYWWSTRMFLVAALAEDYSRIRRLVFVERGSERIFVGMAAPGEVRRALAKQCPALEQTYQDVKPNPPVPPSPSPPSVPSRIVFGWNGRKFKSNNLDVSEAELRVKVDAGALNRWLDEMGTPLTTESVDWDGITRPYLVRSLLIEFDSPYVALLRQRRLDRVVDRPDLALRLARRALGLPATPPPGEPQARS